MNIANVGPLLHLLANAAMGALIASIWQGMVLVAAVALCLRYSSGLSAAVRAAVWAATLAFVVLMPAFSLILPHPVRTAGSAIQVQEGWSLALATVWLLFSMGRGLGLLRSASHLHRVSSTAVHVSAGEAVEKLLVHGSRQVRLCTSSMVQRPCVAGFVEPRILIPAALFQGLSAVELEQIVRHEMEHLRRRDDWSNLLQQVALVLLPLNPAVVWVDRRLATERELACDDAVLQATGARKTYAACLARIAENAMRSRGIALAVALVGRYGRRPEISLRVERILAAPARTMSAGQKRLTLGMLGLGGVLVLGAIARSPQLVSFNPTAQLLPLPLEAASNAMPAGYETSSGPRPQLVKAIMLSDRSPRVVRTRTAIRRSQHRNLPRQQEDFNRAPVIVMTEWHEPPQPPVRPTLASYKVSPPQYAAIRFADGWLIVQL